MKLPPDAIIAREKLTLYLLVRQARGDKSAFLASAGYTLTEADQLAQALRELSHAEAATPLNSNQFGQYYELKGKLCGPNGRTLRVKTIWIREHLSGKMRFVTLVPDRKER
jgi:hypothetical protein